MSYENNPGGNFPPNDNGRHHLPPRPPQPVHQQNDLRILSAHNSFYHAMSSQNGVLNNNSYPKRRSNNPSKRRNAVSHQSGVPRIMPSRPASPNNNHYIFVVDHGIFPANTALEHLRLGRYVFDHDGYELKVEMTESLSVDGMNVIEFSQVVRDPGSKSRGLRKIVGRGVDPATEEFLVGLLGRRESDRYNSDPFSGDTIPLTNRPGPPSTMAATSIGRRYVLAPDQLNDQNRHPMSAPLPVPYSNQLYSCSPSLSPGTPPPNSTFTPRYLSSPHRHSHQRSSSREAYMDQLIRGTQRRTEGAKPSEVSKAEANEQSHHIRTEGAKPSEVSKAEAKEQSHHKRTSSAPPAGRVFEENKHDESEGGKSNGGLTEGGSKYGPAMNGDNVVEASMDDGD